ncbi:unnamed protein product [Adineta steineri]|uniref:Uncharacterized protein n=1 Tax=Adineta steineri TaxID=433720 RepID=A0A815EV61_9BILA|nr:unnamed protein product [Adineta steineri]CAF1311201.1 unnamed protein product [Adineta steineri]
MGCTTSDGSLVSHSCNFFIAETEEQLYQNNSIANFKTSMLNVGAIELFDDDATDIIKRVTAMEEDVQDSSDDDAMSFGDEFYVE